MALGRYNGSRGRPQYPNAVFAAQKTWDWKDAPSPPAVMPGAAPMRVPGGVTY